MADLGRWVVSDDDAETVLQTPASAWWVQGLLLVFVVPPLLLVLLTGLAFLQGGDDPVAYLVFDGIGVLLSVPCVVAGVWTVAVAGSRSAASRVTIDWSARTLTSAEGAELSLDAVTGITIRQPNTMLKWRVLEATRDDGDAVVLARRVSPSRFAVARALAAELGGRVGVPVELPADVQTGDLVGLNDKHAAAFCYVPFHGIFILASLWYLFQAKERPFVRFAAVQSLLQVVVSTVVLLGLLAASGGLAWAEDAGHIPEAALLGALIPTWLLFFAWHVGSRIVATVAAVMGHPVVFPWLWPVLASRRPDPV